jgi:hypothetical protein
VVVHTLAVLSVVAALAHGATIVSVVGDPDALGTGTVPGGVLPRGPFDNRSPAELAATDGSENTDIATSGGGLTVDNTFLHRFTFPPGLTLLSAVLEIGIGGLQTNDNDPATSTIGEDALRLDGVLIPEAFAGVDQGPTGYGILRIDLPTALLAQLNDGQVSVLLDLNSNAGFGPSTRAEPVFYDFSRISLQVVPEPSSALLLLGGVAVFWGFRRNSRRS